MAHYLDSQGKSEISDDYIRENFESFSKSNEFLTVPYSCLKEIISKDSLNVTSEKVVFEAVLKWVKASPHERQFRFQDLLSEVRMSYLPYDYLMERASSEELFFSTDGAKDLIEDIKKYHMKPTDKSENAGFKTLPRNYSSKHILYAVCHNRPSGLSLKRCNFTNEEWSHLSSYPCTENVLQVIATSDSIFIFLDKKLLTFNLEDFKWGLLEVEHEKIGGSAVALYDNMIFCFGSSLDYVSDRIRCFDIQQSKWLEEKKMKSGRCYPAAAPLGKYIVVTGGYSGSLNHNTAEKYDPSTNEWDEIAPMLSPRFGHGCLNVKDKLYVCGGFDKISQLRTAEMYDPLINQWKLISSMKIARQFFSLVSCNLKIYAMGGLTEGYEITRETEIYDLESDQWMSGLPAPEGFEFAVFISTVSNQNVHQFGDVSKKSPNVH